MLSSPCFVDTFNKALEFSVSLVIFCVGFSGDWEDFIPEPPDGGWGWVIVIASFFNNFILDGIAYCFGVFLMEYAYYFKSSVGVTSLSNALLCGVYLLIGETIL